MNNKLFSIDYFATNMNMIELPFSPFDWKLLELLKTHWRSLDNNSELYCDDFQKTYIEHLLEERVQEMFLMILPQCKTMLS